MDGSTDVTLASILVDIDAAAPDHPALEQAVQPGSTLWGAPEDCRRVAPRAARVRHFVTPDLEQELVDHRHERLTAIADAVQGVTVTTDLLRGRPGSALTHEVLRFGHDLLVRSHAPDSGGGGSQPFGAIDMELLRQCPCPVWLIGRPGSPSARWRIFAAVHANPKDDAEQALNGTILDWALTLKAFGSADLTVLQAWIPYGASLLKPRMSPGEFRQFIETSRRTEDEALSDFVGPFTDRLTGVAVELVEGEPQDAVARFVESHGIDVVVMGTVARTGIAGLVMGGIGTRA